MGAYAFSSVKNFGADDRVARFEGKTVGINLLDLATFTGSITQKNRVNITPFQRSKPLPVNLRVRSPQAQTERNAPNSSTQSLHLRTAYFNVPFV